eukprot:1126453-Pelagomonas_calceolata.AAC.1
MAVNMEKVLVHSKEQRGKVTRHWRQLVWGAIGEAMVPCKEQETMAILENDLEQFNSIQRRTQAPFFSSVHSI